MEDIVYGKMELDDSILDLTEASVVQRLKGISQGGAVQFAYPEIKTTRFEHSVGVSYLIKLLGGDLKEQVAGLLHDVSHTAFSHVVDYVLENQKEDYHETIKEKFLTATDLNQKLEKHNFTGKDFYHEDGFPILEKPLPKLCADRIDYTLRDLISFKKITPGEAREFIDDLVFYNGEIAVRTPRMAEWFKQSYQILNNGFFRDPKNLIANDILKRLLKSALQKKIITLEDFVKTDQEMIEIILSSKEQDLLQQWNQLNNIDPRTQNIPEVPFKERVIEPLIK